VETPQVSDSRIEDGFTAWMGGSRSSLDVLCFVVPSQQARGGKAW
jgi:hypothetical protein